MTRTASELKEQTASLRFVAVHDVEPVASLRPPDDDVSFPSGEPFATRDLFGRSVAELPGPQGYLAEAPRRSRTGPHFHPVDQFQLFFPAPGAWYRRHPITSMLLHYVDAYVTYGPFGTAEHPFDFFTLRAQSTVDIAFMPRQRGKLVRRGRRNEHVDLAENLGSAVAPGAHAVHPVLGPHDDGLAAHLIVAGPGTSVVPPVSMPNGGTYYCLVRGSIVHAGNRYEARTLGWSDAEAPPQTLQATDDGFEMLVLQFPVPTAA